MNCSMPRFFGLQTVALADGVHSWGRAGSAPCFELPFQGVGLLGSVCSSLVSPICEALGDCRWKTCDLYPGVFPKGRAQILFGRVKAKMYHEIKEKTWNGRE